MCITTQEPPYSESSQGTGRSRSQDALLIPADDLVAYIADDYLDELSEYYIIQNINDEPGALNRLMAKGKQKELAVLQG